MRATEEMAVPERLVTIRTYDSPDLAIEDHRALLEEGFDAYLSSSHLRPGGTSELRVPEGQAEAARELLPPELPTLHDLTRPSAECRACGGRLVHEPSAVARYLFIGGLLLAGSALVRGDARAAIVITITTIALAAVLRQMTGRQVCERCGTEWRRARFEDPEDHL